MSSASLPLCVLLTFANKYQFIDTVPICVCPCDLTLDAFVSGLYPASHTTGNGRVCSDGGRMTIALTGSILCLSRRNESNYL